jgi:alpha-glucosidase (family GH31 glycosyl hydrolase)
MDEKVKEVEAPPVKLLPNEFWWGGIVNHHSKMPFHAGVAHQGNLYNVEGNQACPLLVSSQGRYFWSEQPFVFDFAGGEIRFSQAPGEIQLSSGHGDLRSAYLAACRDHFPPTGRTPAEICFTRPQYNSWMDLMWEVTQEKVLHYARDILASGMPPGVFMIDDNWYHHVGGWEFDLRRFPDPKGMIAQLHEMGFQVVVWLAPFICPDTYQYRLLNDAGMLLKRSNGKTWIFEWWDGFSALVDLTNEKTFKFLTDQLDRLVSEFKVDGFKFDAGEPWYFTGDVVPSKPATPHDLCELFARVGLRYSISEYRACWKLGGQHLIQRTRDKRHEWGPDGMADVVPSALAQGLMGYPFNCPDMIGGGQMNSFYYKKLAFDPELYLRWAQAAAFFPIVQFSLLPSRMLKGQELEICMDMLRIRQEFTPRLLELVRHAAQTGEPILRHMAYIFPNEGLEQVNDQYMIGDDLLVAPVLEQAARTRTIRFPAGTWRGDDGSTVKGPCAKTVDAPLARLPRYTRA